MKAVVLGASGHLGNAITRALLQHGASVTACGRNIDEQTPNLQNLNVSLVAADRTSASQMQQLISGHELVVDAAAPYLTETLPPWKIPERLGRDPHQLNTEQVRESVQQTRQLLEIVRSHNARYLYLSSFTTTSAQSANAGSIDSGMGSYRRIVAPYFHLKQQLENVVHEASATGVPVITLKPSICIGPWEQRSEGLIPVLLKSPFVFTVRDRVNFIDVRDVAACAIALVEGGYYGATTHLCGHNVQVSELIAKVLSYRDQKSPLQIPSLSGFNALAAYSAETMQRAIGMSPSFPALAALLLCESYSMQPSSIQKHLGLTLHALDDSVRDAVWWTKAAKSP